VKLDGAGLPVGNTRPIVHVICAFQGARERLDVQRAAVIGIDEGEVPALVPW
jgi:hypothetical protein